MARALSDVTPFAIGTFIERIEYSGSLDTSLYLPEDPLLIRTYLTVLSLKPAELRLLWTHSQLRPLLQGYQPGFMEWVYRASNSSSSAAT